MFVKNKTKLDFSKIPARKSPDYLKKIMRTVDRPDDREKVMRYLPLELGDVRLIKTNNILENYDWSDYEKIPEGIVEFVADPDYLHFLTKYILNLELLPYQLAILRMMWLKPFFMFIGSRGAAKSFLLAVYIVCRLIMHQGCRICVVGAALRQSLVVFNYVVNIWNNAPVLQDICGGSNAYPRRDINMHYWEVGLSKVTFLPLGDGETIRGQRANIVASDEFGSVNREVFETVVRGFAAVKSEGVTFNVAQAARNELKGLLPDDPENPDNSKENLGNILKGNQIIVSGTPSFEFNHFYKYFQYYRAIILSGGNKDELREQFPEFANEEDIDATEYCIVRLPYSELPPGLMDDSILSQGRATMDKFIFMMEYCACFARDSAGFFPASVVQRSTCPMEYPDGKKMTFYPCLELPKEIQCVMGIDPASESDNFAINIVAVFGSWRGTVYQWVTNRRDFEKLLRDKLVSSDIVDYQTFCIKKIRSLTHRFNIKLLVLDDGGGGLAIREGLKDPSKFVNAKDQPFLDMDDENTEAMDGLRILKMISFRDATWRRESHWGLKKDIELRKLLFPEFDIAKIALEEFKDEVMGKQETHDTIHDCWDELEQMKREMILIKHEITSITGQEKWDVPTAYGLSKELDKQKMKKDRFTSLLLANWGVRLLDTEDEMDKLHNPQHPHVGGVTSKSPIAEGQPMYYGVGAKKMKNGKYYTGGSGGSIYDINLSKN